MWTYLFLWVIKYNRTFIQPTFEWKCFFFLKICSNFSKSWMSSFGNDNKVYFVQRRTCFIKWFSNNWFLNNICNTVACQCPLNLQLYSNRSQQFHQSIDANCNVLICWCILQKIHSFLSKIFFADIS